MGLGPESKSSIKEKIAKAMLIASAVSLLSSVFFPYWWVRVKAPQYPQGLKVAVYLDRLTGDVREIDGLNHYIGMRSLHEGAKLERELSMLGVCVMVLLLIVAVFWRGPFWVLLVLPAVFFPAVFAADLFFWLREFGLHLDPHAPFSSSVKPFVPPILGQGKIAQFHATANFAFGHGLSMLSMILIFAAAALRFSTAVKKTSSQTPRSLLVLIFMTGMVFSSDASAETLVVGPSGYSTIQSALEKAAEGDTLLVKPGLYHGPLVVGKSVKMIGEGFPIIDGGGQGTVVRLNAPNILFKGFVVRHSGELLANEDTGVVALMRNAVIEDNQLEEVLFGIYLHNSHASQIRNNILKGKKLDVARRGDLIRVWRSDGVLIENNQTKGGRDVVLWFSKNMTVRGNEFFHGRYGIHFMYCKDAVVEENVVKKNSVGTYLMYSDGLKLKKNIFSDNRGPSGFGIGFKDMKAALIEENIISGNRVGLYMDSSAGSVCLKNLIAYNDIGAQIFPSSQKNRFKENDFIDNAEQVTLEGASTFTVNDWNGNYWSDYRGYDIAGDGVGDVPYESQRFFEQLADRYHDLKIFSGSSSVQALDFASSTFPVFQPIPKFKDAAPLMKPADIGAQKHANSFSSLWMLVSTLMMAPLLSFFKKQNFNEGAFSKTVLFAAPSGEAVSVKKLTKRFGKVTALKELDLKVSGPETVALWGPNGAGKTTLLRCLLGIIPYEGEISILGMNAQKLGKETRRQIGYVPQEIRLHQDHSLWETAQFYARLREVPSDRAKKLVEEWGLWPSKDQLVQNLSGGMKQKLALIIALLSDPPILFLDEPTSNLDVYARADFEDTLLRLKESGKTLIFCSHRYPEILQVADRVVVLENGLKKNEGPPSRLREEIGDKMILRLIVSKAHSQRAEELLSSLGMAVEPKHGQLWVKLPSSRKAEPFQILARESIAVLDFDVEMNGSHR